QLERSATAQRRGRHALAAVALAVTSGVAVTSTASASDDPAGAPDEPATIRMGWGIPAEDIKYLMMSNPELAENMGTWYEIEWNQFAGTALGVQGLAAGT